MNEVKSLVVVVVSIIIVLMSINIETNRNSANNNGQVEDETRYVAAEGSSIEGLHCVPVFLGITHSVPLHHE